MALVTFVNDDRTVAVAPGTTLSRAALDAEATIPFGCRAGTCGTCVLRVERGLESLDAMGFVEQDTLTVIGADDPCARLGCQIILRGGDVAVRWEDD
jgi:ferredoxin